MGAPIWNILGPTRKIYLYYYPDLDMECSLHIEFFGRVI